MRPAYDARVIEGADLFVRNVVRLAVLDVGRGAHLMSDGTWQSVPEGVLAPEGFGVVLPSAAIEAIAIAIQEWQGHTSHADTEARVLREWLAVERARVDRVLEA